MFISAEKKYLIGLIVISKASTLKPVINMKSKWREPAESSNFNKGKFQNLSVTPVMAENASIGRLFQDYFRRPKTVAPSQLMPSVKTDLKSLHSKEPVIVWFGHSSYLIHTGGTNILVDPVFSGYASPFGNMVKAFAGSNVYSPADMPEIDMMIITHNHYDHLDKKTISLLGPKTKLYYTAIGVGKDLAGCNIDHGKINEMDWWEIEKITDNITLTATPARHFSDRGLKRGGSLWASFFLEINGYRIFIGGDSGYDTHFEKIGDLYGPFDMALLECGQYNVLWPNIHMMPEETVQAAIDLKAKVLMPVHWGKFTLANHPWNEPAERVLRKAAELEVRITVPMIGEPVRLAAALPDTPWWNF